MDTLSSLTLRLRKELGAGGIDPSEAELIVAHCLHRDLEYILAHPDRTISENDERRIQRMVARRSAGYSLAVLKRCKDFYGLRLRVTEDTLVPRPESELLVERVLEILATKKRAKILDVGTGSGNLIIAIAKHAPEKKRFSFVACDISAKALAIARHNAKTHRVPIAFYLSNLFSQLPRTKFDIILANLPYLTTEQLAEPSIKKEPVGALWGGSQGIDLYRQLLATITPHLASEATFLMEIDPGQVTLLQPEIVSRFSNAQTHIHTDLGGLPRVIEVAFRN